MGTVFSGVGLVSGLDIQSLVEGLVQIDARPRDLIQQRIERYDAQRTAYLDVSARLASALSKIRPLSRPTFFRSARGVSSNPDALGVTVNSDALPGSYNFRVQSLATTHQLFSNGLRSRTTELAPGTLTLESAAARVDVETRLDELNGYRGVQRGSFKLIDGAGTEATIDVGNARTVQDVVDRINESELRIQASVRNDALHLTELDGGEIRVREVNGGRVAADLGFTTGNT